MSSISLCMGESSTRVDGDARPTAEFRRASVVHVGHSAVVLQPGQIAGSRTDRLLVVTGESGGLMPGGIRLSEANFVGLRAELINFQAEGTLVDGTGWAQSARGIDLHILPTEVDTEALRALHRSIAGINHLRSPRLQPAMDPEPCRRRAPLLTAAASAGKAQEVQELVFSLIGAGPGTTPTGDDVLVGILAGYSLIDDQTAFSAVAAAVIPLLARTTVASRHYLSAAIDGRFGEHIHEFVSAVTGCTSPAVVVRNARTWGSSSGIDTLIGMLAPLDTERLGRLPMERSA